MQKPSRAYPILVLAVLVLFSLACSCGSLSRLGQKDQPVAMPGLAGRWRYPATGLICTIDWDGAQYVVRSCIGEDGEAFEIRASSWSAGTLSWTFYVPSTRYETSLQVIRLSGDELLLDWLGTPGIRGITLRRVP